MDTAIVENGYIKVTKDGRFFRTHNGRQCKLIKSRIRNRDYYYITYKDVKGDNKQIHRLAHNLYAEAFIPNEIGEKAVVMAKDDNLLNISTDNLYWTTNNERLSRYYKNQERHACAHCGKKVHRLKEGELCAPCKQKEFNRQLSIKRKEERLKQLKEEFQHVDMDAISTREADMINMRINDCTLEEIGEKYDLSRERVRQILTKVKKKF